MKNKATKLEQVPPDKGYYIAGFVDGEGSFYISARKRKDYSSGWKFTVHFNVSNADIAVLQVCKKYLGSGEIREPRPGFYVLEVTDKQKLKTFIVPFFKKFGFLSNKKKAEFRIFRQALRALEGVIRSETELHDFLVLRQKLNQFRKTRITHVDAIILESFKFVQESSETIR
jgi:hypothetical protein|uniref:Putative LAGLIDADG homing endonuclease n=1 Tax=Pleurastrosarcina brevispinosa TaxID=163096 RepID=Q8WKX4_9CHLO|nr:putative protein [Chlorosarcina brevispinosa]AIT94634.1 putative LAGLIDADG homing endonuclease [Chlorosarcina brevispinosa]AIT94646.1 putative LAGLIDADG homing endonuclease [Chlorosarcina brevispinosa]